MTNFPISDCKTILGLHFPLFVSKYLLYFPDTAELQRRLEAVIEE